MTDVLRILQEITTDYSIFENDQVLTERQLNKVTDYLNDQNRLTRIYLVGVGAISGLQVSLSDNTIKVTPGIGVTTDGDLLYYSNETVIGFTSDRKLLYYSNNTVFNRFVRYDDNSNPKYTPFYPGGNVKEKMIEVYELIPQGASDQRDDIFYLSAFTAKTTKDLKNMVVVLLMESYVNDPDLCTGTDCDNLGKDCINTTKLLLVDKDVIGLLTNPEIVTPDRAFSSLNEIVVDRPLFPSSISETDDLNNMYLLVCNKIHNKLLAELPNLYPNCSAFLSEVFPFNPINVWERLLVNIVISIQQNFDRSNVVIQYYYDFLKDVAETYNQFRDLLFGDTTWCCPDTNWFPKHLILGNLVPTPDSKENRTPFYPSPVISQTKEFVNHAKFLARKLDTLIRTFQMPVVSAKAKPIRVTPSLFEDKPLDKRAIPYYYQVNETNPIHKNWNYHLHQRGMDLYNYSYNADLYGALGGAHEPIASQQIGRFSFFRIEGHLGQSAKVVREAIMRMIKDDNLPFSVIVATLGNQSQTGVVNLKDLIGIEHFGGVGRGGTFVLLVSDTKDAKVIADFMLPLASGMPMERLLLPEFAPPPNEFWPPIAQPGVNVTLFGKNFNIGNLIILFDTVAATSIIDRTNTEITVTVPNNLIRGSDVSIKIINEFGSEVTSKQKLKIPPIGGLLSIGALNPNKANVGTIISIFFRPDIQPNNPTIWFAMKQAEVVSKAIPVYGNNGMGTNFTAGYNLLVKVPLLSPGQVKIAAINEFGIVFSSDLFTVLPNSYLYGSGAGIVTGIGGQLV